MNSLHLFGVQLPYHLLHVWVLAGICWQTEARLVAFWTACCLNVRSIILLTLERGMVLDSWHRLVWVSQIKRKKAWIECANKSSLSLRLSEHRKTTLWLSGARLEGLVDNASHWSAIHGDANETGHTLEVALFEVVWTVDGINPYRDLINWEFVLELANIQILGFVSKDGLQLILVVLLSLFPWFSRWWESFNGQEGRFSDFKQLVGL
jgi:hypothetical protein